MRKAQIFCNKRLAGILTEIDRNKYIFQYDYSYVLDGSPIGYNFPISDKPFYFSTFPVFFENLLSEGWMKNLQNSIQKISKNDLFGIFIANGAELIGAITAKEDQ